jgi:hypothetical protein
MYSWYVDLETVSCLCDAMFKSRHVSLWYDDNSISCNISQIFDVTKTDLASLMTRTCHFITV